MKIKIAQLAPLWIPVPPKTYGGIELMLSLLTEELVKREHIVSLFASGDSVTSARLEKMCPKGLWLERDLRSPHAVIVRMLTEVYSRRNEFDIIHNHAEFFMYPMLFGNHCPQMIKSLFSMFSAPIITTLHRPIDKESASAALAFPEMFFCAISQDHKKRIEAQGIEVLDVVYNGIDEKKYDFNEDPEDYFLYLGRLNKEKGVIDAIKAAQAAGVKLIVAGNIVGEKEWQYFFNEIQPLLSASNIKFVGEVDFLEKVHLIRDAKGLLFPIDRDEPFGLVMIEAMACGTPVIAYNRGSVCEVIEDKITGFIVSDVEEMARSIGRITSIRRLDCRKRVEQKFTLKIMVDKYEKIYKKVLNK